MAILVPTIYNAAISGVLAGLNSERSSADPTATDYAAERDAAVAFATALDTAIGADATLASAGATIIPATAAQANAAASRPALMQGLCRSYFEQKGITGVAATDTNAATYTVGVAAIKAQYVEALTAFSAA